MTNKQQQAPMKPGYYWAKWRIPADGTHEGELLCPSDKWELVQVNANHIDWESDPSEDEALSVSIPGVRETQWRDCFIWGDFVCPLEFPKPQDGPAHIPSPGGLIAAGQAHAKCTRVNCPICRPKKDWRIGLSVKAKYRTHQFYYEPPHKVIDVFPTGRAGIVDKDGVLMLEAANGNVFLVAAGEWRTA